MIARITNAGQSSWPGDHAIKDLDAAGFPAKCMIKLKLKLKLFALDHPLMIRKGYALGAADQKKLRLMHKRILCSQKRGCGQP